MHDFYTIIMLLKETLACKSVKTFMYNLGVSLTDNHHIWAGNDTTFVVSLPQSSNTCQSKGRSNQYRSTINKCPTFGTWETWPLSCASNVVYGLELLSTHAYIGAQYSSQDLICSYQSIQSTLYTSFILTLFNQSTNSLTNNVHPNQQSTTHAHQFNILSRFIRLYNDVHLDSHQSCSTHNNI